MTIQIRHDRTRFTATLFRLTMLIVTAGVLLTTRTGWADEIEFVDPHDVDSTQQIVKLIEPEGAQFTGTSSSLPGAAVCSTQHRRDVWELSTRHLSCGIPFTSNDPVNDLSNLQVCRLADARWWPSNLAELLDPELDSNESNPAPKLAIVYAHGNWMERNNARQRVQIVDQYLAQRNFEPYRLIMFSWPSQRDEPIIRDVRGNAVRADYESFRLALLLRTLQPHFERISIIGFSFGARSVAGALQLDAGGAVFGYGLPNVSDQLSDQQADRQYRVSLVASAADRDWLTPQGQYALGLEKIDHLVNLYNSNDPILRRFRFINSRSRPVAAGFAGIGNAGNPRATRPIDVGNLFEQYDCGKQVGSTHDEQSYYRDCCYFVRAIDNLFWQ